jgi:hypothetical protein
MANARAGGLFELFYDVYTFIGDDEELPYNPDIYINRGGMLRYNFGNYNTSWKSTMAFAHGAYDDVDGTHNMTFTITSFMRDELIANGVWDEFNDILINKRWVIIVR